MTIVSLYARVSSRKQAKENTIESQIGELEYRINGDRHELLDEYKFIDNGYSGSNLERPGLESLRDKVAEGKIDKVYVHSPDRLSRKSAYQMILLEEFKKAGLEVIFLNHKFDDNPDSNLLLQVQGAIAEYERAKIMERNRRGKLYAAKKGCVSVMSNAPYGYRYIKRDTEEAKFEINEEEAEVVRRIFAWVGEERVSIREVARRLNEMSVITQTGKGNWRVGTIHKILKNPAYKGQAAFGKTKLGPALPRVRPAKNARQKKSCSIYYPDKKDWIYIPVPSIVDEVLFNIVQEQLIENKKRVRARRRKETYLLQGLVVCQHCQYAYCGICRISNKNGKKLIYYYYRCCSKSASEFNDNKICDNKTIRMDVLETAVWEEVKNLLKKPDRIIKEYQHKLSESEKPQLDQAFEKQENKIKRSISMLITGYTQEYISQEEFEPRIKAMNQSLKEIKEQKEKMKDQKKLQQELNLITSNLKSFSSSIESKLDQLDWQAKQGIIRALVKQIEINHDNLYIVFRIKELAQERQNQNLQHCHRSSDAFFKPTSPKFRMRAKSQLIKEKNFFFRARINSFI